MVFTCKPDGIWRFCQDFYGLNNITKRPVEPLPHVDQPVDETCCARFFTKMDLAMAYMQFQIREVDQYKTSFRVPSCQYILVRHAPRREPSSSPHHEGACTPSTLGGVTNFTLARSAYTACLLS